MFPRDDAASTRALKWRFQAVDKAMDFLSLFMNVAGGLSISSVVEMLACLVLTVRVVTIPIIMRCVNELQQRRCLGYRCLM